MHSFAFKPTAHNQRESKLSNPHSVMSGHHSEIASIIRTPRGADINTTSHQQSKKNKNENRDEPHADMATGSTAEFRNISNDESLENTQNTALVSVNPIPVRKLPKSTDVIQRQVLVTNAPFSQPIQDPEPHIPQFIARLNAINPEAITYSIDEGLLNCTIVDDTRLTFFDEHMRSFIGREDSIPLRFVYRDPTTQVDQYRRGTVDLLDLESASPIAFQQIMLHILEERFAVAGYTNRRQNYREAHRSAVILERAQLRDLLNDDTIRRVTEVSESYNLGVTTFFSDRGYRIETHVITSGGLLEVETWIIEESGNRTRIEDFIEARERSGAKDEPAQPDS